MMPKQVEVRGQQTFGMSCALALATVLLATFPCSAAQAQDTSLDVEKPSLGSTNASHVTKVEKVECDIVIAGGSTASLATAITAAEADSKLTVCFTEITDWPGGQMTAGGVPAIDFGGSNQYPSNQPKSFRDFFNWVDGNPGACTVSIKCYLPNVLVDGWIMPRLNRLPNLKVFLRTAVVETQRSAKDGSVVSITAVQRTPVNASAEYSQNLSQELDDWYSPADSKTYTKKTLELSGKVFVEATELGDVLATSGLPFWQGVEVPAETSYTTESTCGQAWTLTFYLELLSSKPKHPRTVPQGNDAGKPWPDWNTSEWIHSWTWRRSMCAGNRSQYAVNVGDITQQNLGNDLDTAYLLLSHNDTKAQRPWKGGVNMTAMKMLEDRAYGYFHLMLNNTPVADWKERIVLNYTTSGTVHGLSKFPYLRDSRRANGMDGFRLTYPPFDYFNVSQPRAGYRFNDTIAIGNYNDDTHHLTICPYPPYMLNHTTKPYYIPFRALTVDDSPNLLVAGKTMSQTFHANGATRLHPSEWTSGVAAGGTAVFMLHNGLTSTRQAYQRISDLQSFLNSSVIGQPLEWSWDSPPQPPQIGYSCVFNRCVGVDHAFKGRQVYNTSQCDGSCAALAKDEWLANGQYWTRNGNTLTAKQDTILKKSFANSQVLPPSEILAVASGTNCTLELQDAFNGYYLCRYDSSSSVEEGSFGPLFD